MKFAEWLIENRWSVAAFSVHTNISMTPLWKVLGKRKGMISLRTARLIEKATEGKVKMKDLLPENDFDLTPPKMKKTKSNDDPNALSKK